MQTLKPAVVSHFDLIRLNDPDYPQRIAQKAIWGRIVRNLTYIKEHRLIMDLNLRSLKKGQLEPYITRPILQKALELHIPIVPGDDSHGVADVGNFLDQGIKLLQDMGGSTNWVLPESDKDLAYALFI